VVQLLVEAGADVNAGSWPPLCIAVDEDNVAIAQYLIAHGANVNAPEGWTALQEAPYASSVEMVELLIAKGANINAGPWTALHSAVDEGRKDMAEELIAKGADVNAKDGKGRTPLHLAAWYQPDMVESLLSNGADVNARDNNGKTALLYAIENSYTEIAELLIAKGVDVSVKDNSGRTALHTAAENAQKDMAEFLIARGADINAKDKEGHTPLHIAVHHDYKVAELLIDKGADGDIKTESGRTLFQLAQERKSIESTVPDVIFDGEPNTMFGTGIACGDVDGDGYDDIVVGGMKYDNYRGRAYLFYGGPDMDTICDLIFEGEKEGGLFGGPISCGDIDNDGYDDIVIGAPYYNNKRGRAYLYWGSKRDSMDSNPDKIFDGEAEEGAYFSLSICPGIYDIDNDGYRDIIISAIAIQYPRDLMSKAHGKAYLYYGNTKELMDTSYDLIFTAENADDCFGIAIGCGDVDNDSYGDIIIGAIFYPGRKPCQGRAYLYYGDSKSNMDAKADKIFDAESKGTNFFGQDIVCQDSNNDDHDDIVIGAQGYKECQGRVYLFYGGTRANLDTGPDKTFDGERSHSDYGFHLVCGDIDGDNQVDIVIGADRIRESVGRVYVYWGSELSGPSMKPGRILTGENPGEWFSNLMACGDVNNDGFDDLVIGARGYKAGSNQGRAYLYYGGPKN